MKHTSKSTLLLSALAITTLAGATSAQAELVADLNKGVHGSFGTGLTTYKGKVYFAASAGKGSELYVASSSSSATLLKDIFPGSTGKYVNSSAPRNFCEWGGKLYFTATFPSVGRELGVTDGTAAGTKLAADLWTGKGSFSSSSPAKLTPAGGNLFCFARTGSASLSLFVLSGTKVIRLASFGGQGVHDMARLGATSSVVFSAQSKYGVELWVSNGTVLGTKVIADLRVGSGHSWPGTMTTFGKKVLFAASPTSGKRYLYTTDGTGSGTKSVGHSVYVSSARPMALMGGYAYFSGDDGTTGRELWKTDGTKAGTSQVIDLLTGVGSGGPDWITSVAGKWVYFAANKFDGRGRELWRSNGTESGTVQVAEIYAGTKSGSPSGGDELRQFAVNGDRVYFGAIHPTYGRELFSLRTDAATSYKEGVGCGANPRLAITFPKIGKKATITVSSIPNKASTAGLMVYGAPAKSPVALGGKCFLRVDPTGLLIMSPFTATGTSWSVTTTLPTDTGLIGLIAEAQAAIASGSALGFDVSNGVRLLFGK